jgi:hypothetical protein
MPRVCPCPATRKPRRGRPPAAANGRRAPARPAIRGARQACSPARRRRRCRRRRPRALPQRRCCSACLRLSRHLTLAPLPGARAGARCSPAARPAHAPPPLPRHGPPAHLTRNPNPPPPTRKRAGSRPRAAAGGAPPPPPPRAPPTPGPPALTLALLPAGLGRPRALARSRPRLDSTSLRPRPRPAPHARRGPSQHAIRSSPFTSRPPVWIGYIGMGPTAVRPAYALLGLFPSGFVLDNALPPPVPFASQKPMQPHHALPPPPVLGRYAPRCAPARSRTRPARRARHRAAPRAPAPRRPPAPQARLDRTGAAPARAGPTALTTPAPPQAPARGPPYHMQY